MLANLNLPPKFAVALDPDFIRALSERAARMRVTRRTCRPLRAFPGLALLSQGPPALPLPDLLLTRVFAPADVPAATTLLAWPLAAPRAR